MIEQLTKDKKILQEKLDTEQQLIITLQEREAIKDELIKQTEQQLAQTVKYQNELKQQAEESDLIISKTWKELQDKLVKMSENYLITGKIEDQKESNYDDMNIDNLDEKGILMLEIKKYRQMVKCPQCGVRDRCVRLGCKHTFCKLCIDENIS